MKKIYLSLLALVLVLGTTACSSNTSSSATSETSSEVSSEVVESSEVTEAETIGVQYLNAFLSSTDTDASTVVQSLIAANIFEADLVDMEVSEGYLNGFTEEITGFSKGVMFSPMIGSIAFVGYVFETEDTDALIEKLNNTADPRWNVCTEADETVYGTAGNLVFFLMCTNEE